MDPLIHSVSLTLAQDVRELVHATRLEPPALLEKDPPNWRWHWHMPLGFASLAAAGFLLAAAGGVQSQVQERKNGARRHKTKLHKQKVRELRAASREWINSLP
jgi:hypothetical protein